MLKLADLAKLVQEYFHDCDPCGDMLKRDRDLALKIARACLTEAATVAWHPQPGEIYAPCLAHGHGSCGAQCHRTASDMIRTILAQLEKGAAK